MHLFVYGTLRRDAGHPMHGPLRECARLRGRGRTRGILYMIGERYPGLVLDATAGWVTGELYQLHRPAVLERLDEYEGASERDPEPREYRRVRAPVRLDDGRDHSAWIYEYAWPIAGRVVIASGDFLRREG
ncbi:MAG: gamma-glutamylcyclotransferase [Myxococcales bacterium]|nr:gamma-glutamylcyclotransferase [Myxococcales bacterium]MCB9715033.1 gamma-glutamylcyclotransferase [Myxococcales bacterium]